jgi:hypothetical protein
MKTKTQRMKMKKKLEKKNQMKPQRLPTTVMDQSPL